jgi:uncharacterized membrane protein YgaE (UPF0421/DUF939 family)
MINEEYTDGFDNYDQRIDNLLLFIKQQNAQAIKEEAFLNYHNKNITFKTKKKYKSKSKAQVRKEQLIKLQKQVPKMGNVSKFFNF